MSSESTDLPSGRLFKTDSTLVGIITRLESKELILQSMLGSCAIVQYGCFVGVITVNMSVFFQSRNR